MIETQMLNTIQRFDTEFKNIMNIENIEPTSEKVDIFDQILGSLTSMKEEQRSSKLEISDVLMGNSDNAYNALISLEKANLQMQFASSVRDKAVNGINQMLNMQI